MTKRNFLAMVVAVTAVGLSPYAIRVAHAEPVPRVGLDAQRLRAQTAVTSRADEATMRQLRVRARQRVQSRATAEKREAGLSKNAHRERNRKRAAERNRRDSGSRAALGQAHRFAAMGNGGGQRGR